MSQKSGHPTSPSERIVRDIRRATRKHHAAEDKIRIVLDGLRGESSIAELCRREGLAESLYYTWLNSPEFSRHPRRSFSAAIRSRRATASRSDMFAFGIVEHLDVIEHVLPCIGARFVGPAHRKAARSSG